MWVETLEDGSQERRTANVAPAEFPELHAARRWYEYLNELLYPSAWGVPQREFDEVKLLAYTSDSVER